MAALDFLIGAPPGSMAAMAGSIANVYDAQKSRAASHYLALRAASECMVHDKCVDQERDWNRGVLMTNAEAEAFKQFLGEYKAKRQCMMHHGCIVAESSTVQDSYTYQADFEEPARLYW